jgi:hypothetical protein
MTADARRLPALSTEQRDANERLRADIVTQAVASAEHIILHDTDGSVETLLWLTMEMARVYQEKAMIMVNGALHRKELLGTGL